MYGKKKITSKKGETVRRRIQLITVVLFCCITYNLTNTFEDYFESHIADKRYFHGDSPISINGFTGTKYYYKKKSYNIDNLFGQNILKNEHFKYEDYITINAKVYLYLSEVKCEFSVKAECNKRFQKEFESFVDSCENNNLTVRIDEDNKNKILFTIIKKLIFPQAYNTYEGKEKLELQNEFTESELKTIQKVCEIDYGIYQKNMKRAIWVIKIIRIVSIVGLFFMLLRSLRDITLKRKG